MRRLLAPLTILVALVAAACGGSEDSATPAPSASPAAASAVDSGDPGDSGPRPVATVPAAAAPAPADPFVLVLLGDSLASGEGLPADATFAVQLADQLAARRLSIEIRDDGAAGGAASAAARFGDGDPEADAVVIALGADDLAARGSPAAVGAALAGVIEAAQARGLWVGLIGLEAPLAGGRSVDPAYERAFNGLYDSLAATYRVELYPDFFAGLVDRETGESRPELFLDDGVHPTDLGTAIIADGVADWLADTLPRDARGG